MDYVNPHAPMCPWYDITEKTGAANIKWCEETLCLWISEPANTWSNLGYMIIAVFIMYYGFKNKHNFQMKQFGPIIFFMGAMSYFYHMSNFYISQILDFVGMFFFVGWVISMNLVRIGIMNKKNIIWFNLALGISYTILMHAMYMMGIHFQMIVLFSAFIIIGTEIAARKKVKIQYKWFLSTLGFLVVAFGFSISDNRRIWCDPTQHGWFSQGHAMWHWVSSLAMLTIYLHFSQPSLKPTEK